MLADWQGARAAKLHQLAAVTSTRVASVLRASLAPPPPLASSRDASPPPFSLVAPPTPPPAAVATAVSPGALAVGAVVVLLVLGQVGLLARLCAPARRALDSRASGPLGGVLALVWALLNVPAPAQMPISAAEMAAVKPSAIKARGKKAVADAAEEAEVQTSLIAGRPRP